MNFFSLIAFYPLFAAFFLFPLHFMSAPNKKMSFLSFPDKDAKRLKKTGIRLLLQHIPVVFHYQMRPDIWLYTLISKFPCVSDLKSGF